MEKMTAAGVQHLALLEKISNEAGFWPVEGRAFWQPI